MALGTTSDEGGSVSYVVDVGAVVAPLVHCRESPRERASLVPGLVRPLMLIGSRAHESTNVSGMSRELATAAPAGWGDVEPDPSTFEPVPVRAYFPNRALYRTRGRRQGLRESRPRLQLVLCRPVRRGRGTSRMHRARRVARTCGSRGDPSEPDPDLGPVLSAKAMA
jgi:hypothetical protein